MEQAADSEHRGSITNCAAPRVFVSYAWEDDGYRTLVKRLATRFRVDGVDARLDAWHLEGLSIPEFMNREVRHADKVLVLCSPAYRQKVHAMEDGVHLSGVGWEAMLITTAVWTCTLRRDQVEVALLRGSWMDAAPHFLLGHSYMDLSDPESFEESYRVLLRKLTGRAEGAPPLGYLPPDIDTEPLAPLRGTYAGVVPRYRTRQAQELSERLQCLIDRRDRLCMVGAQASSLDAQILDARRALRSGAPEPGWEFCDGRYLLLEELGHGGFATVWKARDRVTPTIQDEFVAIKVIHSHLAGDPQRVDRFFRGARIMMELQNPGIVRVLNPRCEDQGYLFFVMELIEGGTLNEMVRQGKIELATALQIVLKVAEALADAHVRGYVHRDVKPANILLTAKHDPKLSDFDLVGVGDTTGGTRTGALGTYSYSAPECLSRPQEATSSADVYSLGMTLLFALTGKDPELRSLDSAYGKLPCGVFLQEVLRKATKVDPSERYPTSGEFALALKEHRNVMGEEGASIEHVKQTSLVLMSPGRISRRAVLGIGAAVLGTIGSTTMFAFRRRQSAPLTAKIARAHKGDYRLVRIPGGSFLPGSPKDEKGRAKDEDLLKTVDLDDFYLGVAPVTNAEYARFLEENPGREKPRFWRNSNSSTSNQPVVGVSWDDADAYCVWAGLMLPTEAQWEYACRAGTKTRFWSGDTEEHLANVGWYKGNSQGRLHDVGEKSGNPFGLHDMHGNVWEWCRDWYAIDYSVPAHVGDGCRQVEGGKWRVVRGGGWHNDADSCRSANRYGYGPGDRDVDIGFRPAKPAT